MPLPILQVPAPSRLSDRLLLLGPVGVVTLAALALALHALPLHGAWRLLFAGCVAGNVWVLAMAFWSGVMGWIVPPRP